MNNITGEIKYKVNCPLCSHKVLLISESTYEYVGYCDNCERHIKLVDDYRLKKDGSIEIVLR